MAWLHHWKEVFTNEGRGTLHDPSFLGTSTIRFTPGQENVWWGPDLSSDRKMDEVMQLDAGFGALTAVFELLVQNRRGEIWVLPNLHAQRREAEFDDVGAEGAFRVGVTVREGKVQQIRVKSLKGGRLRVQHGLGSSWRLNGQPATGERLDRNCRPGEMLVLDRSEAADDRKPWRTAQRTRHR